MSLNFYTPTKNTRGAREIDAWAGGLPKAAANGFPDIEVCFAKGDSVANVAEVRLHPNQQPKRLAASWHRPG
jgi:hypothetical protein